MLNIAIYTLFGLLMWMLFAILYVIYGTLKDMIAFNTATCHGIENSSITCSFPPLAFTHWLL